MTAPAVIAPAPETTAPVAVAPTDTVPPITQAPIETPTQPEGLDSVINRITNKRTVPTDPVEAAPDAPRLDGDTIVSTVDTPNAAEAALAAPVDDRLVESFTADEPEGEVVLRSRAENGTFAKMDKSQTFELSIKDKETGETKVYQKNLDGLMRLAKDGIAMQKSRDELTYYRENVPQWQQQVTERDTEINQLRAIAIELLTADESVVIQRRNEYLAEQTPDKIFARREAELHRREQELTRRHEAAQRSTLQQQGQALATRIGPAITEVEGLVGKEAAVGHLTLAMSPFLVNGVLPPERFAQVEAYVNGPYREWAKAEAAKSKAATTEAQQRLESAKQEQARAQSAVRTVGQATKPIGGSPNATQAPQAAKPKSMQDAIERIVRRPMTAA